jgi:hypothetical protein
MTEPYFNLAALVGSHVDPAGTRVRSFESVR